jgi:hypothetical protein
MKAQSRAASIAAALLISKGDASLALDFGLQFTALPFTLTSLLLMFAQ